MQNNLVLRNSLLGHLKYNYRVPKQQPFYIQIVLPHINYLLAQYQSQQMERDSSVELLRSSFQKFKQFVLSSQPLAVRVQIIEQKEAECKQVLTKMEQNNDYTHLQQLTAIQDTYRRIKQLLRSQNKILSPQGDVLKRIKRILGQEVSKDFFEDKSNDKEQLAYSSVEPQDVTIPDKSKSIDNFFKKKQTQISKKQSSFKRILDSKQFQIANETLSNKSLSKQSRFSKSNVRKGDQKQRQLKYVIEEHKKMVKELQLKIKQQEELNEFQKNLLKEEKNRYLNKIEEMQNEIEQLYRDNFRLKELEKTLKPLESFQIEPLEERSSANLYQPYIIKTRTNDLNRINQKNRHIISPPNKNTSNNPQQQYPQDYLGSKLERDKPLTSQNFFSQKPQKHVNFATKPNKHPQDNNLLQLLSESYEQRPSNNAQQLGASNHNNSNNYSIEQGSRFDTFQMANTLSYINDSAVGQSRQMVRMSSAACTRNKVAFFKNSLVLVREPDIEIAYKRSQLDQKLQKTRIIFYINNKSPRHKRVHFDYQFQHDYFKFEVLQKLQQLNSNSQGREVLEVTLISQTDLNAVTDMHIEVGDTVYDLWLPLTFIRFKSIGSYRMTNQQVEMTVVPDRQFSTFNNIQSLVPIMFGGNDGLETWAYLHGESKFGSHTIKLTWRPREVIIETTEKWIDFIGFVIHFFK